MTSYRIEIDRSLCSGFGACVTEAPGLFRLENGIAVAAGQSGEDAALEAAAACPAISVYELASGRQAA